MSRNPLRPCFCMFFINLLNNYRFFNYNWLNNLYLFFLNLVLFFLLFFRFWKWQIIKSHKLLIKIFSILINFIKKYLHLIITKIITRVFTISFIRFHLIRILLFLIFIIFYFIHFFLIDWFWYFDRFKFNRNINISMYSFHQILS